VRADGPRGYPQHGGGGLGVQVEEHPQRDHLTLPGRQPPHLGQQRGIHDRLRARRRRCVVASQRHFPAAATPPGDTRVERGAHHPGARGWVLADGAPGHQGPDEALGDQVLGQMTVAHARQHGPQTGILAGLVEPGELAGAVFVHA